MAEKWRGTKKPLDQSKRGEWKSWLKAQHSEDEDHGSGPITSWEIDGETVETVSDFVFLELSCFFHDPADVGNLISGSSVFSKTSLNIWKFMVHVLLKPGLENFDHYFSKVCEMSAIVW